MRKFWQRSRLSNQENKQVNKRDLVAREFARAGIKPGVYVRSSCFRADSGSSGANREFYPWVLATEQPVETFDWRLYEFWPEVLLADGFQPVKSVRLLDNHRRRCCADVLGSVLNIKASSSGQYSSVDGDVYFAGTADVATARQKVEEGHITDGSVGYVYGADDVVYVGEDTEVKVNGRGYTGPVKVVTRWWIKEFSLTPIGADTLAKVKDILGG